MSWNYLVNFMWCNVILVFTKLQVGIHVTEGCDPFLNFNNRKWLLNWQDDCDWKFQTGEW